LMPFAEPVIVTQSLSLSELRDIRKDYSHHPDEQLVTWLLRCWDSGASSMELEGREARQLGSLSREGGIDKAIGKDTQNLSLWKRLLSSVRERYPFNDNFTCQPSKWTTMEIGIQYLRELAVQEVVYYDPDNAQLPTDPDEVRCTGPMWRTFVRSTPSSYASGPTVNELVHVQQLKENMSYSPPAWTRILAIRSSHFSTREKRYTPRGKLRHCLHDCGEDMKKWDGKPTYLLEKRTLLGKKLAGWPGPKSCGEWS
uniref:Uncharacterized protein n=1 Tax=Strix occidentalis caurina TaxID=311401 RepID=A0A8D0FLD9_STROC